MKSIFKLLSIGCVLLLFSSCGSAGSASHHNYIMSQAEVPQNNSIDTLHE